MERYRVSDIIVEAGNGAITRRGERLTVPPLTFNLLLALIRRAPAVVSRRELLDTVWTGEVVSDAALSQRISMLRHALDEREPARYVASARGWGYSMAVPVQRLESGPDRISVLVVMPFAALSQDPSEAAFAAGLTEALIATVAKVPHLDVISRASARCYGQMGKRPQQIGRELGADGVIEGSVLLHNNRIRVCAQLVHAATDRHLWAQSYRPEDGDLVKALDEIADAIGREVARAVRPRGSARPRRSDQQ